MRKQKEYSTLKVQQEMLKAAYNEKKDALYAWDESRYLYNNKFDTDAWLVYKGVALYRLDKPLLNLLVGGFAHMNIQSLLISLSEASNMLDFQYHVPILTEDKKHEMIVLVDEKHNNHKIDKKFLDLVNLDPFACQYYIPEVGKNGIVAVRDEDGFLLAGIMEVK